MQSVPPEWHDLNLFFSDIQLHAEYGLTRWLAAELEWALRIVHLQFTLEDLATRQPIAAPFGGEIHHRTETLVGPNDPWLSLRAVKQLGPWAMALRLGLTLPIGSTVPNPFALGREGKEHHHIQFGTGTVDPLVGTEIRRLIGRFTLTGWLFDRAPLYENGHGYRAGNQLLGGMAATSNLWLRRWTFSLGLMVFHEEPERWSGIVETEGNLGRTDLLIDTAVGWQFADPWSVSLAVRVPIVTWAVGAQMGTPALGVLSVSRRFDLLR